MTLSLANRQIILGITGGIAAYKACELARRLQDAGCKVRVAMTPAACEFVTPLTLQALTGEPVHVSLLDPEAEAGMGHIELARWADAILIAPASADFIARLAQGQANDLLTTLCLATKAPIFLAPAMNQQMWAAEATQDNLNTVQRRGVKLFGPAAGVQACGDVGLGRMLEVPELVTHLSEQFDTGLLAGKRVLITAGPTREALDPVRYISNHSSGKMGFAIAKACADAGALTTLVAGPVNLATPARVSRVDVVSALDMYEAVMARLNEVDIVIASAAVADYRAETVAEQKMKKTADSDTLTIRLVKNPDIVASVAGSDTAPFTVGFAAETNDVEQYAQDKMARKKLDMIVANDVSQTDIGFGSDDNAATVFSVTSEPCRLEKMGKQQLAQQLVALIAQHYQHNNKSRR